MEAISIFILWGGAFAMFLMLKIGSTYVESSLKKPTSAPVVKIKPSIEFRQPDAVGDIIGQYMNTPIYCKITVGKDEYHFSRIENAISQLCNIEPDEWLLEPGVIYSRLSQAA